MKFSPRAPRRPMPENVVPLINVVFLLLVFFLLAGDPGRPPALPFDLPEIAAGADRPGEARRIAFSSRDGLRLDGEVVTVAELETRLAGVEGVVTVSAEASLPARRVLDLLDALAKAGLSEVYLETVEP